MATFGDLLRYLERASGWAREPNLARGRQRTGDHVRYANVLPDGSRRRTKVSGHPREEIGADLFGHILRDQLTVTEEAFWAVVHGRGGTRQSTGSAASPPSAPGIPGWLVVCLIEVVGLPEEAVLSMTPQIARATWDEFRSRPRS